MKDALRYEDFILRVDSDMKVRVLQAPYGATEEDFKSPLWIGDLERVVGGLEKTVRDSGLRQEENRDLLALSSTDSDLTPEKVGSCLFNSVFHGSILQSFMKSLGRVESRPNSALRLRLVLDPSQPRIAPLCALPWELLYRSDSRDFLGRQLLTTTIRQLQVPRLAAVPEPAKDSHLRILVALASPKGMPPLNLDEEKKRIRDSWGSRPEVQVEFLDHPTLQRIFDRLRDRPSHIFHFMGHGTFDPRTHDGTVLFEEPSGTAHPVSGKVLSETLRQDRQLRLVFINACRTAQFPRRDAQDPFTSVASALVLGGVPAVLAMQFPITDRAAIAFSGAFYSSLAGGDLVESAVTDGRMAVYHEAPRSYEWATPVLFLNMSEGRLFHPSEDKRSRGKQKKEEKDGGTVPKQRINQAGGILTGDIRGNNINVGSGEMHFHEHRELSPDEEAQHYLTLGLGDLSAHRYREAARSLQIAIDRGSDSADAYYSLALSALAGRRPGALNRSEMEKIEECLDNAVRLEPKPHYCLLWAFVKYDFFVLNGLRVHPPSPQSLVESAIAGMPDRPDTQELLNHIPPVSNNPVSKIILQLLQRTS
jgi:hypothetical protein